MKKGKSFSFLFAFLMNFTLDVVGKLFMAEALALFSLPIIEAKKLIKYIPYLRVMISCLISLLFAQVISDIINNSSHQDYLRGWALILFGGVSAIFLIRQFIKNEKNIIYFLLGVFIVKLLFGEQEIDLGIQNESSNYFKVRIVGFANAFVLVISFLLMRLKKRNLVLILFLFYTVTCFFFDARSNGLAFFLSTLLLFLKFSKIRLTTSNILMSIVLIIFLFYGLYIIYVDAVLFDGFGGSNAYTQLSKAKNPYNPLELIYQGRIDFFVLVEAIKEKPIFGHGSWGKDTDFRYAKLLQLLSDSKVLVDRDYISAHSILLGFWAYAGILGAASISLLYFNIYKLVFEIYSLKRIENVLPIVLFISIQAFWHFFFSPIQEMRFSFPFFAAIILSTAYRIKFRKQKVKTF